MDLLEAACLGKGVAEQRPGLSERNQFATLARWQGIFVT